MKNKKLNLLIKSSIISEKFPLLFYSLFIIISTVLLSISISIVIPLENNIDEKINNHILNREITVSFPKNLSNKDITQKINEIKNIKDVDYVYEIPAAIDTNEQSGVLYDDYKFNFIHKGFPLSVSSGRCIKETEQGVALIPNKIRDYNEETQHFNIMQGKDLIGKTLKFSDITGKIHNIKIVGSYDSSDPIFTKNEILIPRNELLKYSKNVSKNTESDLSDERGYIVVTKSKSSLDTVLADVEKISTAYNTPLDIDVNTYNVALFVLIAGTVILSILVILGFYMFLKNNIDNKTMELALYRSLGYKSKNIFYIIFSQHFVTGIISLIIGLVLAEVLNRNVINHYINNLVGNTFMKMNIYLNIYQIIFFVIALIIILLFVCKKAVKRSEKIDLTILLAE